QPAKLRIWLSTDHYQMGKMVCYDLANIFSKKIDISKEIHTQELTIKQDSFLNSDEYLNFKKYKNETRELQLSLKNLQQGKINIRDQFFDESRIQKYLLLNPEFYQPYYLAGQWYQARGQQNVAGDLYQMALKKELPREVDRQLILQALEETNL
ncbi:MAG: hypothetical protein HQL32_16445, partial [Planctomycetes bacterium]|nr:hypothetical protein [Planctomycetota bacterium]